ncbi:MAG: patatin-like phospholipase family protein [Deltaproteobacteria bacterium]|nr:patatin-like phospholipase family protein [Deltaproteobacteria bacterium]
MRSRARRLGVGCTLLGLAMLASSGCSYFSYPENPLLEASGSQADYRLRTVIPPTPGVEDDQTLVILTLSGGGTRAAALAYGVMRELDRGKIGGGSKSLLDEVDVISSVSGGSFAAAYYGLFGKRQFFEQFKPDVLNRSIECDLILRMLAPWNWPRLLSPYFGRSDLASEYYDKHIFKGRTFADLPKRRPFIVLNAADMTLGAQFTFTQDDFDKLCSDLSAVHVARAVTASSAFPGGFSPLTLNNYPKEDCGYRSPGWFAGAKADLDNVPSRFDRYATWKEYERDDRPYIHLFDGGLADNLGLRGAILALSSTDSPWKLRDKIARKQIKRVVVIIVDAKPKAAPKQDRCARPPGLLSVVMASGTNPMENYSTDSVDLLENKFYEERRLHNDWLTDQRRCTEFAAANCRGRRHRDDCEVKFREGCETQFGVGKDSEVQTPDLYRIYVRFAAADDSVRDRLNHIDTTLQLSAGDVNLLIDQGAVLLHKALRPKDGDSRDLVKDLGIEWKDDRP